MSTGPLSPTSANLARLHAALTSTIDEAKHDIESRVGAALTSINAKLAEVNAGLVSMEDKGRQVLDKIDQEKADNVTQIQSVIASAQS